MMFYIFVSVNQFHEKIKTNDGLFQTNISHTVPLCDHEYKHSLELILTQGVFIFGTIIPCLGMFQVANVKASLNLI